MNDLQYVAEFEHGTVYGGSKYEAQAYGVKHVNRFGRPLSVRPATEDDPLDEYRICYTFKPSSPARQRFEANMEAKRLARAGGKFGQLPLFAPAKVEKRRAQ